MASEEVAFEGEEEVAVIAEEVVTIVVEEVYLLPEVVLIFREKVEKWKRRRKRR
jgi:hypothetical protein